MKHVIGHRGAAGLALENSAAALQQALKHKVAGLEIDVRLSKDHQVVLCHDADLKAMAGDNRRVADLDWDELKRIPLRDGSHLIRLREALELIGSKPVIIEIKDDDDEAHLLKVLDAFPKAHYTIASFKRSLLIRLREQRPELRLYVLEHTNSLDALQFAKRHKLQGVGLNFWLLSPSGYWHSKRAGLDVYLYTVNSRFLGWFLHLLYPRVSICTDHPERFKQ